MRWPAHASAAAALVTVVLIAAVARFDFIEGSETVVFVVGDGLASQVAAWVHHRGGGGKPTLSSLATLGLVLSFVTVAAGLLWNPFSFPEISLPIAAVGAFVFPFVLTRQMWGSLSKAREKREADDGGGSSSSK